MPLFSLSVAALAFTRPAVLRSASSLSRCGSITASATDAVTAWLGPTLSKMESALELIPKGYAADLGFDTFNVAGQAGTIKCYEAPGKNNVAWCSGLQMS